MAITAESLIQSLALVDENILAEAARQPILFIDAARYRVGAMRRRAQAAAELDATRSRVALVLRARNNSGEREKKLTDAGVKDKVETQTAVRTLRAGMERAYEVEELSKLILEAYRMRRDAIRVIAETQIAEGMRGSKEVERIEQTRKIHARARTLDARRNQVQPDEGNDVD
jgi:hypothetical protein